MRSAWLPEVRTMDDLLKQLGGVPARRVRLEPRPGSATLDDVLAVLEARNQPRCELVDGVLVEKAMGSRESFLAGAIFSLLLAFLRRHRLGIVLPGDGILRILPGLVRIPDVSFISRERLPRGRLPRTPVAAMAPDLATEVYSEGNRPGEMRRKVRDYLFAGVQEVWIIYPRKKRAMVHKADGEKVDVPPDGFVDGGTLLPGFRLVLSDLFADAEEMGVDF